MEVSKRRGCVVAGSVWESRMKSDEVKGGIKVFKAEQNAEEEDVKAIANGGSRVRRRTSIGKRKTWKPEEECKEVISSSSSSSTSTSIGIKKSPRKIGGCAEKVERRAIQIGRLRSSDAQNQNQKGSGRGSGGEGQLRKSKSNPIKKNDCESDSIEMRKTKSDLDEFEDEARKEEVDNRESEKIEVEIGKEAKDFDACDCQEKEISSSLDNVGGDSDDDDDESDKEVVVVDEEDENESFEVKEISIPESKKVVVAVNEAEAEQKKVINEAEEPKKVVSGSMRFPIRKNETRPVCVPLPVPVKQSPSAIRFRRNSTIYQPNSIPIFPKAEEHRSFPETQSKLQSLVNLIMWRDVSRSAFVFGIGTFIIISSSYAKDINLSLISALSYLALLYLALIFLYRSLICRGIIDVENSSYVVGEEDAIWMLKLILPYLNEFLSKLKALFSGDPGTTIKLAVLLFVLARCGSFITIWKMARFGFFGVFTLPIICSSYSAQLSAYGNFWIHRFRDAWDSCTHKKAVALSLFGLVWNLSSVVARIWAVFVLFVAFRYYQQHYLVMDDERVEDEVGCDETWQEPISIGVREKQGGAPNFVDTNKVKKGF